MKRNLETTQGLIFSQRVLLTLIDKGLIRKEAYELVQRNSMKAWQNRTSFLKLLKADKEVIKHLSAKELDAIFDYGYFLKHVDDIFQRLHLLKKRKSKKKIQTLPATTL
jgi:adenylosuccinate lyase